MNKVRVECKRCRAEVEMPLLSTDSCGEAASRRLEGRGAPVIKIFFDSGMTVKDAKFLAQHLVKVIGRCNRCDRQLAASGITSCENCNAMNIDWNNPVEVPTNMNS